MFFKIPKNTDAVKWTNHIIDKMRFYGISPQKVKNILTSPKRKEIGIAEGTMAAMRSSGSKKNPSEIWLMYKKVESEKLAQNRAEELKVKSGEKIIMISAWRYPGISPIRETAPIPLEIEEEIFNILEEINKE